MAAPASLAVRDDQMLRAGDDGILEFAMCGKIVRRFTLPVFARSNPRPRRFFRGRNGTQRAAEGRPASPEPGPLPKPGVL